MLNIKVLMLSNKKLNQNLNSKRNLSKYQKTKTTLSSN